MNQWHLRECNIRACNIFEALGTAGPRDVVVDGLHIGRAGEWKGGQEMAH